MEDLLQQDFVMGGDFAIPWDSIEVADGVFNWSTMDATFAEAAANGFFIETAFWVGDRSPAWIYNRGNSSVPKVMVDDTKGSKKTYPYYLDPEYKKLFLRAMDAFAAHIDELPATIKSRVTAVQAMYGSTGDDCAWHCAAMVNGSHGECIVSPAKYEITDQQWHNFTMSTVPRVCEIYTSRKLRVLWNTNWTYTQVQNAQCPGSFYKQGSVSHGFQINDEYPRYLAKGKLCHKEGVHCRGESYPFCERGYYLEAPLWATYSQLMWQLTFGIDMPGLSARNLVNASYTSLYRMFNVYAPSIRPPASAWVGAIVALRDGLDADDFGRFPVSKFGNWTHSATKNEQRVINIANDPALKARGVRVGDPKAAVADSMASRKRNSSNDVGRGIFVSNYGNGLLTQIAPQETSVGWWHVGSKDQPYGRFARSFEHASARTQMSFALDQRLWGGLPRKKSSSSPLSLVFRVVYFDGGAASFNVTYDSTAGCRTLAAVRVRDSGRWKKLDLVVDDGSFGRRCATANETTGADIVLVSTSTADTIIHGLEISAGPAVM
jgi:hypothetical protein